jgi:hypothetical protein
VDANRATVVEVVAEERALPSANRPATGGSSVPAEAATGVEYVI